ncbi:MAG: hypothetical protein ACLFV6_06035 [Spirulinaceae cyanobacterium]
MFIEDIDFRIMAKGFLGKHTIVAGFVQFRSIAPSFSGRDRPIILSKLF